MIRISPANYHVSYQPHLLPNKLQTLETVTGIKNQKPSSKQRPKCWDVPPVISIVGISRVRDSSLSLSGRFFWLFAVLICVGLCIWQLYNCTLNFFSENVIQNVDIIRNSTVTFPAVYICPGFMRNVQSSLTAENIQKCASESFISCFQDPLVQANVDENKALLNKLQTAKNLWQYFALNQSSIRVYKPCSVNDENCNQEGRAWNVNVTEVDTFWGTCLALNTVIEEDYRGPFTYFTIEYTDQMHIKMMKQLQNATNKFDEDTRRKFNESLEQHRIGLMFHLHSEYTTGQQHRMFFSIQDALQGFNTHVELRKQQFDSYNGRRSPCVTEQVNKVCLNECFEKSFSPRCRMPYAKHQSDQLSECNVNSNFFEVHVANYKAYASFNESGCKCLPSCKDIKYAVSIDVIDKIKDDYNARIKIKFYFPDNTYDITTEKLAYELTAYLSDVGGNLGFFLGFCVLNILELVEFVFYLIAKYKEH